MKNLICILLLIGLVNSCKTVSMQEENSKLFINQTETPNIEIQIGQMLMTHSGSMQPSSEVKINGINFTIVQKNGDTTHWSTNDTNFITPEGYKVGTNWEEISLKLRKSISIMPGWGYYIKLNSNWQLGFCEGFSCTDFPPTDNSYVKWIFRRNE